MTTSTQRRGMHIASLALFLLPHLASAATLKSIIEERVLILVNPVIAIVMGLALIFFIWGLARFILNAGNEQGREEGKKVMLWGIIALFVIVSVWGIVQVLQQSIFGDVLPPTPAPFEGGS